MLQVVPVPCLDDNYAYLVLDTESKDCLVVDPVEPTKVLAALAKAGRTPADIKMNLTTHHHDDHAGGNNALQGLLPAPVPVYGGDSRIQGQSHPVTHMVPFPFTPRLSVLPIATPGHTKGSITYLLSSPPGATVPGPAAAFTGDFLFVGGMGKFFECAPAVMMASLDTFTKAIDAADARPGAPGPVDIYVGHEYTASNLKFAASLLPGNADIARAIQTLPKVTVPTTLARERATNPFLMTGSPDLCAALGVKPDSPPAEILGKVRSTKDGFKG